MLATIAPATAGAASLARALCGPAMDAAQCPEFASEITAEGRGSTVYHALANEGKVPARDFAAWLCLERRCSRVRCAEHHRSYDNQYSTSVMLLVMLRCLRYRVRDPISASVVFWATVHDCLIFDWKL